jgi:hypothetical protein
MCNDLPTFLVRRCCCSPPAENGDGFKHGFEFVDVAIHGRLILSVFVQQFLVEGKLSDTCSTDATLQHSPSAFVA